jgi:hypothetical protein
MIKGKTMSQTVQAIINWFSIPVHLMASVLLPFAGGYELMADVVICLSAAVVIQRAIGLKEYIWAVGLVAVAVVASPLPLVVKIFLLMGFTYIAAFITLLAAFRTRPLRSGPR